MSPMRVLAITALAMMLLLPASGLRAEVSEFGPAQAYVVQKGDTVASIARKFYGKPALGGKLWQVNKNLVAHPRRLTAGDTIYIFPESTLQAGKATAVPPPPQEKSPELYDRGQLLNIAFPTYFSFVADGRGLGEDGAVRVKVKKSDPATGETIEQSHEVRQVGAIIASSEHGGLISSDGANANRAINAGKTYLSTNDEVVVQFTEDLAKLLDSDTYDDSDPYFREFPIYGKSYNVREGDPNRVSRGRSMGEIYRYKGKMIVVARVEGTAPMTPDDVKKLRRKGKNKNQDVEPVTYLARITYSVDAIGLNDKVFFFVPLNPGPERRLDAPFVETPDSYVSLGD